MTEVEKQAAQWRHLMQMMEESDGEYAFTLDGMKTAVAVRKIELSEYMRIASGVCID